MRRCVRGEKRLLPPPFLQKGPFPFFPVCPPFISSVQWGNEKKRGGQKLLPRVIFLNNSFHSLTHLGSPTCSPFFPHVFLLWTGKKEYTGPVSPRNLTISHKGDAWSKIPPPPPRKFAHASGCARERYRVIFFSPGGIGWVGGVKV